MNCVVREWREKRGVSTDADGQIRKGAVREVNMFKQQENHCCVCLCVCVNATRRLRTDCSYISALGRRARKSFSCGSGAFAFFAVTRCFLRGGSPVASADDDELVADAVAGGAVVGAADDGGDGVDAAPPAPGGSAGPKSSESESLSDMVLLRVSEECSM
jgi:hypothetical protein